MFLSKQRVRELLADSGALLEGHFVGTSGNHLSVYLAKDRATRLTSVISELCRGIAYFFYRDSIQAVVAPAVGAIALSQWTAHHLNRPGVPEVLALYSEPEGEKFTLKRGFADDVNGKRILVVEDVLTTGGSARKTVEAVRSAGGIVMGLSVLANGGNVTAEACGVDRLEALISVERDIYTEAECVSHGLCAKGIPINTKFGHPTNFLAKSHR